MMQFFRPCKNQILAFTALLLGASGTLKGAGISYPGFSQNRHNQIQGDVGVFESSWNLTETNQLPGPFNSSLSRSVTLTGTNDFQTPPQSYTQVAEGSATMVSDITATPDQFSLTSSGSTRVQIDISPYGFTAKSSVLQGIQRVFIVPSEGEWRFALNVSLTASSTTNGLLNFTLRHEDTNTNLAVFGYGSASGGFPGGAHPMSGSVSGVLAPGFYVIQYNANFSVSRQNMGGASGFENGKTSSHSIDFHLSAVPEPTAGLLCLIGGVALALRRRAVRRDVSGT